MTRTCFSISLHDLTTHYLVKMEINQIINRYKYYLKGLKVDTILYK